MAENRQKYQKVKKVGSYLIIKSCNTYVLIGAPIEDKLLHLNKVLFFEFYGCLFMGSSHAHLGSWKVL